MKQFTVTFMFLLVAMGEASAQYSLRIEVKQMSGTHINDSFYVAGSFNGWNPGVKEYAFLKRGDGIAYIELKNLKAGIIEFKLTRGSWSKVECNTNGMQIENHTLDLLADTTISITVEAWTDDFPSRPPVSTRSKNVFIVDTAFCSQQLNRKKRIWIYLPEEYAFSKRKYPVLYMHDGQNVFDALTASFGEWGADEMMDSLKPRQKSIIVAIDHGGERRFNEYNPFESRFGPGEGDAYVDFLTKTVKPFVDSHYRTIPDRKNTAVAGSSMGGIISLYTILKYPYVFGSAGIFSPAFWIAPGMYEKIETSANIPGSFYFVCGGQEGGQMVADMEKVVKQLQKKGVTTITSKVVLKGKHNESFWRSEMYDYYMWLYKNQIR